ncbi:aminotransferase class I/II-fold pyridoxal phosphate-dependent enzyme [Ectobacillus polymachus]|uniref:aminotransferase class I/II-fold pyridoxal phosphate-dependent enzyme n=1 Tax=Ectobacillus polymachus TaxID=1508806 RepID=UPI003A85E377
MNQNTTPLYDALVQFAAKKPVSFHVPGHKNGVFFPEKAAIHFQRLLELDVTELTGLDDLHDPTGCILEAEELLADLYEVDASYFLVNGSTVGNLAMLFAVCKRNDIVLVQRNCHKSIMHGLKLIGAHPVFLTPNIDIEAHVPTGVSAESVACALLNYPQAKAVVLTHPNYYGMAQDITDIIQLAHSHSIPVLVDEAHGAHFCLGSPFPASAIAYGADVVVQSAHKTLPAMTMGSYLHINSSLVKREHIKQYLHMLQSSSPSYPIMASLDLARYSLAKIKKEGIKELSSALWHFHEKLSQIPQIKVIHKKEQDLLKMIIQTRCSLSGYELQALLEKKGLYTELADPYNVLLVLPLSLSTAHLEAASLIRDALRLFPVMDENHNIPVHQPTLFSSLAISYEDADMLSEQIIPLTEASGQIAAEMILPYPPGVPIVMPGERIESEHIEHIQMLLEAGARFQGNITLHTKTIRVYGTRKVKMK